VKTAEIHTHTFEGCKGRCQRIVGGANEAAADNNCYHTPKLSAVCLADLSAMDIAYKQRLT